MSYDPEKHRRRSTRLREYDYREDGAYFITICTYNRACVFGEVRDDGVSLTQRGLIANACWQDISNHRPTVELDEFVVMPNHLHGILLLTGDRATLASPSRVGRAHGPQRDSLGAIIGGYKSAVSREINRLRTGRARDLWQINYYDHIIRSERSLDAIREYIVTNPLRWTADRENPDGNGTDDVEMFIRSLDAIEKTKQGDASVAPTGLMT